MSRLPDVLVHIPRAIISPHMPFYSVEAQAKLQRRAVEEVALTGLQARCPVNREVVPA
jgi:phosphoglycerate dehydrogenase-like enzyme